jgi:hypothetical protein
MTEVPFGEEWADEMSAEMVDDEMPDGEVGREPEDRPWTPIPHQARAMESGLIPAQRRLKKTSRSA